MPSRDSCLFDEPIQANWLSFRVEEAHSSKYVKLVLIILVLLARHNLQYVPRYYVGALLELLSKVETIRLIH